MPTSQSDPELSLKGSVRNEVECLLPEPAITLQKPVGPDNDQTSWGSDESLRDLQARLDDAGSSGIRVVSFDFFDTLICRMCAEPSDLFIEVGRQLAKRDLLRMPLAPVEFRSVRIAADERARKNAAGTGRSTEIKLADIYRELKAVVSDMAAACQAEFEIERSFCFLNPAIASLVRHARAEGFKTAVLSDTYFTAVELKHLLRENGLSPLLFDAFVVSCERGRAKWSGRLYHDLFRHFDIHPSELMHIGDSVHADVEAARRLGVEAVHYYKSTAQLDTIFNGEKNLRGSTVYPAGSLNSLRVLTARQAESDDDAFRDGALVFGPVLARYADWCVERFRATGVRTVLALMREGEVLGELVRRAAAAADFDINVVTCYASRLATARAAMTEVSVDRAAELLEGNAHLTAEAVLHILGLGDEVGQLLDEQARRKPLPTPESITGLLKLLFNMRRIRDLLETRRTQSHELAFAYLNSLIGNDCTIGVLDLGWSGSIQRNIARILRHGGRELRTVGCYLAATRKAGRLALEGDCVHAFMEHDWARMTILPEVAITSPIGSTDSYARDASGTVQPVLGSYSATAEERRAKERIRAGILMFQESWLELRASKGGMVHSAEMLADLDQQTAAIFYRLLEYPTKPEADRLGVLCHDENYFGESHSAPLCDAKTPEQLRRDGVQGLFHARRCYWPPGVVARNNPRLVSALRSGWNDPYALGRLGAWHGTPVGNSGFTDEEISSLGAMVNDLAFEQVVLAGPLAPALEEVFLDLWRQEKEDIEVARDKARLILIGSATGSILNPEFLARCALIESAIDDPKTLGAVRAELAPGANVALVLPAELPDASAANLLYGLAPFLGAKGAVLAGCGRFDRNSVEKEVPVVQPVNAWYHDVGCQLGFGLWSGHEEARAHLCNWMVFERISEHVLWTNQWMITPGDLVFADANQEPLLATP